MEALFLGLGLGIVGSLHCVGMCGPLAFALPYHSSNLLVRGTKSVIYNLGRTMTYITLGLALSVLGRNLALIGAQRAVSITIGTIILILLFSPALYKKMVYQVERSHLFSSIKKSIRSQFEKREYSSFLVTGLLNGLLPCGMVYMAAFASLSSSNTLNGILIMAGFGLGTAPMLLGVAVAGNLISTRNINFKTVLPVFQFVIGVIMIARGIFVDFPDIPQMGVFNPSSLTICN